MENKTTKISNISISSHATILEALKKMDDTFKRLLLVFDNKGFINILSIGDIQRAIIRNQSMGTSIEKILRKDTRLSNEQESFSEIKAKMLKFRAECMPVLDKDGNLKDVYFWEDVFIDKDVPPKNEFHLPVIIMAGGLGSRLRPLTSVLPKPLIPIGGKTMLEEIFLRFAKHGCSDYYISVNYKAELIEFYIRTQNLPYNLTFFKEEKPMGTAGSLALLKNKIEETFFVSNCDILIEQDYSEILDFHRENDNDITIVAALKHYPIPYGTIKSGENGVLVELIEKPELTFKINSGMYVLEPNLLSLIPDNTFYHITDLIDQVHSKGMNVGVFPVSEKSWKDVGSWKEYNENMA